MLTLLAMLVIFHSLAMEKEAVVLYLPIVEDQKPDQYATLADLKLTSAS